MRLLSYFNLFGVMALAVLCTIQWDINSKANHRAMDLDWTRQQQAARIADQEQKIAGYKSDLDQFRDRLALAEKSISDLEKKVSQVTGERDIAIAQRDAKAIALARVTTQRNELAASLDVWKAAVAQRDGAIQEQNESIKKQNELVNKAVADRNDAVAKYNSLVKEWNDLQAKVAGKK